MPLDAASKNQIVLERLVADFTSQLNGALEMWTIVCLESMPVHAPAFLSEKMDKLRSVLVVLENVANTSLLKSELHNLFNEMKSAFRCFCDAFLTLERFRVAEVEDLHAAVDAIRENYRTLRAHVEQMIAV